jgi:lipopolysaccharide/colanic/teichoic acid biosynthesis glycosyltransferase
MPVDMLIDQSRKAPRIVSGTSTTRYSWLVPFVILLCDALLLQAIVLFATWARQEMADWLPIGVGPETYQGVHLAVLALPLIYLAGGLSPGYGCSAVDRLRRRVTLTAAYFAAMLLFDHIAQGGQWSRGIMLIASAIAIIAMPLADALMRALFIRWNMWGMPIAVLGPAPARERLIAILGAHRDLGWIPAVEGEVTSAPPAPRLGIKLALLAADNIGSLAQADQLPYRKVVLASGLGDMQSQWVAARDLGGQLGLEMRRNLLLPWNRLFKRSMDLLLGGLLLLPAIMICLPFVLIVQFFSPGPVFYSQPRRGLGNRPFPVLKLRSMYPDADRRLQTLLDSSAAARAEWEAAMKLRHDPRLIPVVAHIMRRLSIDELPQLLNVMRGEMSLVGPRPLPDYHLRALSEAACAMRAKVLPGITGLWQVSGRSSLPLPEMERLDSYYVRNWSIWLDIHILARTLVEVLRGRGAW